MSKTCKNCGQELPRGAKTCPTCNTSVDTTGGAALFTQMTAETEDWRETEAERKAAERLERKKARNRLLAYLLGIVLVAGAAGLIWFTSSTSRAVRAIEKGNYDAAIEICSTKLADATSGYSADRINGALEAKAEEACLAYDKGEMHAADVIRTFNELRRFDRDGDELDKLYKKFEKIGDKLASIDKAAKLYNEGSFFEAYEIYRTINEGDVHYDDAVVLLEQCVDGYAQSIIAEAERRADENKYKPAIELIYTATQNLKNYNYYSTALEDEFKALCTRYEANALQTAEGLARQQAYSAAVAEIYACMTSRVGETTALYEAYHNYVILAGVKTSTAAIDKANEYYEAGEYTAAFNELEAAAKLVDDSEAVEEALVSMQDRFESDMIAAAKAALDSNRDNIDNAIIILSEASQVRSLSAFDNYAKKLESWRFVNLSTTVDFALERIGDVFRNTDGFVSCDDAHYNLGWIWGANGSEITFNIGGEYDRFTGSFAVQRDKEKAADAYFEVWCDGELKYTSDMLINDRYSIDFNYDISGCSQLTLKFVCAYDASSGAGGYCYHGVCTPRIMRNMD